MSRLPAAIARSWRETASFIEREQPRAAAVYRACADELVVATRDLFPQPRPLTRKQYQMLGFIRAYIGEHGYAPTFEELAAACEYRSLATVHEHLKNLQAKGYILRERMNSRGITLTWAGQPDKCLACGQHRPIAGAA